MDMRSRAALVALRETVSVDLQVEDIEDSLMRSGLISLQDKQRIHATSISHHQASLLMDILLEKGSHVTFECLLSSLKDSYPHLRSSLLECCNSPQTFLENRPRDYESVFIAGGIPIVPDGNVELKYIDELKKQLVSLSKRSDGGWILISGRGGAGKSVLAAQAIRGTDTNGSPIAAYFYNRVYWFSIGKFRSDQMDSMLLTKMQNICFRLDPTSKRCPPRNLEAAKDLMRTTMLKMHPSGLIVLDDVWEPKILRHFDIQAKVIVTSRSCDIFSRIQRGSVGRCNEILVIDGFTEDMTLKLMESVVCEQRSAGQVSESFSQEDHGRISDLHNRCKGNPFVISIFAGLLHERPNQFDRYLRKFEENLNDKFCSTSCGDYEYDNIMDAILVSIDDLDEEDRERYLQLSIFPEDSFISARFLADYCWRDDCGNPFSEDDASELMERFVNRSIASSEKYLPDNPLFTLHDLIVRTLRIKYKEKRKCYNDEFVEKVISHRRSANSWVAVEDETDYLAFNFIYHLLCCDTIGVDAKKNILLDFDFISWVCSRIGANNLIFVYRYAMQFLQETFGCSDFVRFFQSPIFRFKCTNFDCKESDSTIIQLALTLSEDDYAYVRGCAEDAARCHSNFLCFYTWLNKDQMDERIKNTVQIDHFGGPIVSFFVDSHCSHAVVALSTSVVVLSLETGSKTFRVRKEDMFTACNLSDSGNNPCIVVSALFGPQNDSLFVLTYDALIRYRLPESALRFGDQPSPSVLSSSQQFYLHFPPSRPRSASKKTTEKLLDTFVYTPVGSDSKCVNFSAMCFTSDRELLLGSVDGMVFILHIEKNDIKLFSQYSIPIHLDKPTGTKVNHITVACNAQPLPLVAVSGPNDCIYVYTTNLSTMEKYSAHRRNPFRCVFESSAHTKFAVSIADNEIHMWNPHTLTTLSQIKGPDCLFYTSIAMSNDSLFLAIGINAKTTVFLYKLTYVDIQSANLMFVDELIGYGNCIKDVAFSSSNGLYSVSEMSDDSFLMYWRLDLSLTTTLPDDNCHNSYFFNPENSTLRLKTVFDAVTIGGEIVVACQHACESLLILKSLDTSLNHVGNFGGRNGELGEAIDIKISLDGKYAIFSLSHCIIVASEIESNWIFTAIDESVSIKSIVVLSNCHGFIGSDNSYNIVLYNETSCIRRIEFGHSRLVALQSDLIASTHCHTMLLSTHRWALLSDELIPSDDAGTNIDSDSFESILCLDSCLLMQRCYVVGGTDTGSLILWQFDERASPITVDVSRRNDAKSFNHSLRCVRSSHKIKDFCLLAGVYEDNRYSLWSLREGRLISLVTYQPVQMSDHMQPCITSCIAWAEHTDAEGERIHKLIITSDCVRVCCLPEWQIRQALSGASSHVLRPSMVSLYSRQSVEKVLSLPMDKDYDLLFVDRSQTVFWMRTLHRDPASTPAPEIPFSDSPSYESRK